MRSRIGAISTFVLTGLTMKLPPAWVRSSLAGRVIQPALNVLCGWIALLKRQGRGCKPRPARHAIHGAGYPLPGDYDGLPGHLCITMSVSTSHE